MTPPELMAAVADLRRKVAVLELEMDAVAEVSRLRENNARAAQQAADAKVRGDVIARKRKIEDLPIEDQRSVLGVLGPAEALAIVRAVPAAKRQRVLDVIPDENIRSHVAIHLVPAPQLIRARVAGRTTTLTSATIYGDRGKVVADGFRLDETSHHVERASAWAKRVKLDAHLRRAIEDGCVVAEPLPDDEARERAWRAWMDTMPAERPPLPDVGG